MDFSRSQERALLGNALLMVIVSTKMPALAALCLVLRGLLLGMVSEVIMLSYMPTAGSGEKQNSR